MKMVDPGHIRDVVKISILVTHLAKHAADGWEAPQKAAGCANEQRRCWWGSTRMTQAIAMLQDNY